MTAWWYSTHTSGSRRLPVSTEALNRRKQTFSGEDLQGGFGFGTPEEPPQIQLQSVFTSLALPSGTSSVTMSIEPVATPSARPPKGIVAGNVYQITVTDQNGTAVKPRRGATVTLVMRGPASLPEATIEQFSGGTWTQLQTNWPGVPDTFVTDIGDFGEFALVAPDAWVPSGESAVSAAPGQRATCGRQRRSPTPRRRPRPLPRARQRRGRA